MRIKLEEVGERRIRIDRYLLKLFPDCNGAAISRSLSLDYARLPEGNVLANTMTFRVDLVALL